jgi:hypothetical protein
MSSLRFIQIWYDKSVRYNIIALRFTHWLAAWDSADRSNWQVQYASLIMRRRVRGTVPVPSGSFLKIESGFRLAIPQNIQATCTSSINDFPTICASIPRSSTNRISSFLARPTAKLPALACAAPTPPFHSFLRTSAFPSFAGKPAHFPSCPSICVSCMPPSPSPSPAAPPPACCMPPPSRHSSPLRRLLPRPPRARFVHPLPPLPPSLIPHPSSLLSIKTRLCCRAATHRPTGRRLSVCPRCWVASLSCWSN